MDTRPKHILVVDDEIKYVRGIQAILESEGFTVSIADGRGALATAALENPQLILLDVRMPGMDGLEACRRIREFSMVPVIMLTALAEIEDKVNGFDAGADDYVTKPFSTDELLARVHAIFRRVDVSVLPNSMPVLQAGEVTVDFTQRRVCVGGKEVHLTVTEYRLFCELVAHAGRVLPTEVLLERVWGRRYDGEDRLVWRSIHRLRQKIELDPENPRHIVTRPGEGYLFSGV